MTIDEIIARAHELACKTGDPNTLKLAELIHDLAENIRDERKKKDRGEG